MESKCVVQPCSYLYIGTDRNAVKTAFPCGAWEQVKHCLETRRSLRLLRRLRCLLKRMA